MLQLIIGHVNPSTRISTLDLNEKSCQKKLAKLKNKVLDMEAKYINIIDQGQRHKDYIINLFNALLALPKQDFH